MDSGSALGAREAARVILRTQGLRGFYLGIFPAILQVLPSSALGYFTYENVLEYMNGVAPE